ncbi:peptide chain release factor N(5)-glutamine methyltransferase [Polymorphospora sp. NPDC051019]|uniref:peptide chain release factor N(5)-glutamine methyltransferase n=1 Tax=Polymorphospora sp. NPDC051019 TaxID=3155725 RepID=UPI0034174320
MTSSREHPPEGTERTRPGPVLATATAALSAAGVGSPRADAEWLATYVLGVDRSRLPLVAGFTPDELARYRRLVARRAGREPLQHLLGSAAFRYLELAVGPGVFVPRPETELLAEWGIARARKLAAPLVVDLCSGSGAIALSVAHEVPAATVYAVERSAGALEWLRRNAASRVAAGDPPVRVVAADVTDPDLLAELTGRVDVLLCNPPYVPAGTDVPPEVADHDPAEAVFAGADGLGVIRPVVRRAAELLAPGGVVGIEHDDTHPVAVPAVFTADGRYADVTCHPDLAGRPRFSTARRVA